MRFVTVFVLPLLNCIPILPASETPGVVTKKPATGRFVAIDDGYMVPYQVQIPGTTEKFWMEPIPPGIFRMGSPETEPGRNANEGPRVTYKVDPFWMGRHEVTQGEFRHFMAMYSVFKAFRFSHLTKVTDKNRVDAVTSPTVLYEPDFVFEYGEHVRMPIATVTQYSAKQYTKWLTLVTDMEFRLPTEAEWEYACRAGSTTAYHFGDNPDNLKDYAWFEGNSYDEGWRKVGLLKPNPWGLFDMHGNVSEWVHDHLENYPDEFHSRVASRDWVQRPKLDPKVARGGNWLFAADQCRSASRLGSDMEEWQQSDPELPRSPWWCTDDPARGVGLRVVRPLAGMTAKERVAFWEPLDEETVLDIADRIEQGRGALGIPSRELMEQIAAEKKARAEKARVQNDG